MNFRLQEYCLLTTYVILAIMICLTSANMYLNCFLVLKQTPKGKGSKREFLSYCEYKIWVNNENGNLSRISATIFYLLKLNLLQHVCFTKDEAILK